MPKTEDMKARKKGLATERLSGQKSLARRGSLPLRALSFFRLLALFSLALLALFGYSALAAEPPDGQAHPALEAYRELAGKNDLQTDFGPPFRVDPPPPPRTSIFPEGTFVTLVISAVLIGLIVVLFSYRRYLRQKKTVIKPIQTEKPGLDVAPLLKAGEKADLLVQGNRIIEAMHSILLDTIEELKTQRKLSFPPSTTSREIASQLALGERENACLYDIVAMVEPTWFGNVSPSSEDYRRLRDKFDDFLALLGTKPPRRPKRFPGGAGGSVGPAGGAGGGSPLPTGGGFGGV
ncbi:MAG: DUF1639 domain-containing protein [Deltaproteobacteria bacterium]|jgi:hypothetical protein|nr:DUF1639 domain-containing protein [Deltaproteobacteria bacterium]